MVTSPAQELSRLAGLSQCGAASYKFALGELRAGPSSNSWVGLDMEVDAQREYPFVVLELGLC